jgi:GNAT superfamily N-acetyltransferase
MSDYILVSPADQDSWRRYHEIRRQVLFEARGRLGIYVEDHPDERTPGHYPKLLLFRNHPVGAIRIDIAVPDAIFRQVAIRADVQRRGHGRALLSLAERLATGHGCRQLTTHAAPDAVGFYQKCGFAVEPGGAADDGGESILMRKQLKADRADSDL